MRRHRRGWLRPSEPSPLDRATNVGVALPSFNFIEPKAPRRPATSAATVLPSIATASTRNNFPRTADTSGKTAISPLDCDAIVYHTLLRWAQELNEPAMTEESKMTRLWQSLQRHSEAGRFSNLTDYSPNPICSSLALEILQQILQASGVSLMLTNLLIGALGNSIFMGYEPDRPRHEMKQYATIARDLNEQLSASAEELAASKKQAAAHKSQLAVFQLEERDSSTEDKAQLVTAVFRSVEEQGLVPALITQSLTPFFNDELLLLLWNAMAKDTATQSLTADVEAAADNSDSAVGSFRSNRKRASIMATRVLKERVRLMLILWQTLSAEEKDVVSKCLTGSTDVGNTTNNGFGLKGVLQMLEEVYMSEQVRDRSAPRRSMFLSPVARHSSVVYRPGGPGAMGFTRAKSRQRLMSMRFPLVSTPMIEEQPTVPAPPNVSIPDVLLGALAEGQHEAATEESQLLIEQLSNEQEEILRQCEDIFDMLCEDPAGNGVQKRSLDGSSSDSGAQAIVDLAKERMCELLCNYVDAPSFIMEKFERSEADRAVRESVSRDLEDVNGTNTIVQMLVQRQRQNPMILVNAINQSPEILLTAITQNNGILRFAITKFVPLVKRFLRLDLKACEYLDVLAQKNKGIQLLWGAPSTAGSSLVSSHVSAANGSEASGLGSVSAVFEEVTSRRRSSIVDTGSRAVALTPGEFHLMEWFTAHTEDLAVLSLKRPDVLKPLFVEMHTLGDVATFHKVMIHLASTKGVQNFIQRSSVSTLEKIAQEDPAAVAHLLREILTDSGNQDLIHQLRSSPYLTSCLSEFHPTAIQDVISSDMEMWRQYFIDTVAANDVMIKEVLVTRTESLDGAETLVNLFSAVVAGSTAGLNLQALDFGATPTDVTFTKKRDGVSSRKMAQCLYLRGGSSVCRAVITQLIATAGFHPHEHSLAPVPGSSSSSPWVSRSINPRATQTSSTIPGNAGGRSKAKKAAHRGSSGSPSKKRTQSSINKKEEVASAAAAALTTVPGARDVSSVSSTSDAVSPTPPQTAASARLVESMPVMWRPFALLFLRQQLQQDDSHTTTEFRAPTLARAHAKTLILDLWIEFLKVDAVQQDNACLWSLAPFVCDYLVTRYDSPIVVGAWICALAEAVSTHQDDPRIAFFASSCGFRGASTVDTVGDGYDTFLYYAHALGHILFGRMKVFKPECRLEETADGSCPVEKQIVIATAVRLFDHRLLSGPEIDELMTRVEALPAVDSLGKVELDDALDVFLDQWRLVNAHVDEQYRQAFAFHDTAGSNRIGLEQFIKIVTSVTQQAISPRECLLVFCDVGLELLDLDTLLRVTRVYHLRVFNTHLPEIALDESDLQELTQSVGRTNIFSMAREVEDLQRFWKGLRVQVHEQIDALHQSKNTKMHLKKQSALIEKLLHDIQVSPQPPPSGGSIRPRSQQQQRPTASGPQVLHKAWTELRACAKLLQSAKLTQHYLSRLYIQTCIVRWIHQTRKRRLARQASAQTPPTAAADADLPSEIGDSGQRS